jgi:hypothetical protein
LATFLGISGGGGGKETVDLVAGGISEALITTETGLLIAIPGYVVVTRIRRLRDGLELFLRRVENLTLKRYLALGWAGPGEPSSSEAERPAPPAAPAPGAMAAPIPALP